MRYPTKLNRLSLSMRIIPQLGVSPWYTLAASVYHGLTPNSQPGGIPRYFSYLGREEMNKRLGNGRHQPSPCSDCTSGAVFHSHIFNPFFRLLPILLALFRLYLTHPSFMTRPMCFWSHSPGFVTSSIFKNIKLLSQFQIRKVCRIFGRAQIRYFHFPTIWA